MRRRAMLLAMSVAALGLIGCEPPSQGTADPSANQETKDTLRFLQSRRTESIETEKHVSGQHLGNSSETSTTEGLQQFNASGEIGGEPLGLMGADYDAGTNNYANLNPILHYHHNAGGLVTISMHAQNPMTGGSHSDVSGDVRMLVREGTVEYKQWKVQMDQYARGLKGLEERGVPVILRPFHEMNRSSFWWSCWNDTMTPELFKTLWRQTFDYLTKTKGLHNLLFCLHTKLPAQQQQAAL